MSILAQWSQSKDKLDDGKTPFFYVRIIGQRLQLKVWTQTSQWILMAIDANSHAITLATGQAIEQKDNVKRLAQAEHAAAYELRRLSAIVEGNDE